VSLRPARFNLDEEVMLSGKPVRVAGYVQFEDPQAQLVTRYLLVAQAGPPQILEEHGDRLCLLRPFPPNATPVPAGNSIAVMGESYTRSSVRKLTVLGAAGEPPGGTPKAPVVLSGSFEGSMGTLLREIATGAEAGQVYYLAKPLDSADVLSSAQRAAQQRAIDTREEQRAAATEEEEEAGARSWLTSAVGAGVALLVIGALAYACTAS
jgi:hypothetical protein